MCMHLCIDEQESEVPNNDGDEREGLVGSLAVMRSELGKDPSGSDVQERPSTKA